MGAQRAGLSVEGSILKVYGTFTALKRLSFSVLRLIGDFGRAACSPWAAALFLWGQPPGSQGAGVCCVVRVIISVQVKALAGLLGVGLCVTLPLLRHHHPFPL